MSVTTKSHLAEDHSCEQQEDLDVIGNLGEDFGEQITKMRQKQMAILNELEILQLGRQSRAKKKCR
jgi:hypothetical protein